MIPMPSRMQLLCISALVVVRRLWCVRATVPARLLAFTIRDMNRESNGPSGCRTLYYNTYIREGMEKGRRSTVCFYGKGDGRHANTSSWQVHGDWSQPSRCRSNSVFLVFNQRTITTKGLECICCQSLRDGSGFFGSGPGPGAKVFHGRPRPASPAPAMRLGNRESGIGDRKRATEPGPNARRDCLQYDNALLVTLVLKLN